MLKQNKKDLASLCDQLNFSALQAEQLQLFVEAVEIRNSKKNLISRGDVERIIPQHIIPSIFFCAKEIVPKKKVKVLDLGSGAGFPGIPMKIILPEIEIVFLDTQRIKALFIKELVEQLCLGNSQVICSNVENMDLQKFSGYFDVIVSRAVADLSSLWKWSHGLLKRDGILVTQKGDDLQEEMLQVNSRFPDLRINLLRKSTALNNKTITRQMAIIHR